MAYFLQKAGRKVVVREASNRVGGLIDTIQTPWGIVETAAHSFVMTPAFRKLLNELGLEALPLSGSKARYIWRDGKLRRWPLSFIESMSFAARFLFFPVPLDRSQSIWDWASRQLGEGGARYLMDPMVAGIYAGNPSEMIFDAAFPSLQSLRGKHLWRYRSSGSRGELFSIKGGSRALVDALAKKLDGKIFLNSPQHSLKEDLNRNDVVLSCESRASATLLRDLEMQNFNSIEIVEGIRYVPLVTATVFVSKDGLQIPKGIGVLFPSSQRKRVSGVLFNSYSFSNKSVENAESFTLMLGGAFDPEIINLSDNEILEIIFDELSRINGGVRLQVLHSKLTRWQRAIPQYDQNLLNAIDVMRQVAVDYPGLIFFSNYTGQISVRGLVESVQQI